jgi:hypothetical protein
VPAVKGHLTKAPARYGCVMVEAIIGIGVVLPLLILGFWWTRGGGGLPGGIDDPARQELRKYDPLGNRLPDPAAGPEEREQRNE